MDAKVKKRLEVVGWILVVVACLPTTLIAFKKMAIGAYGEPGRSISGSSVKAIYPLLVLIPFFLAGIVGLILLIQKLRNAGKENREN